LPDDSDDDLPESLFPVKGGRVLRKSTTSSRRSSTTKSKPPTPNPQSPTFSLESLLKERQELEERQAQRAKVAALLAEVDDDDEMDIDVETDEAMIEEAREKALGKESNDQLKAVLRRIGGDLSQEGGYRLFKHQREERQFNPHWIDGVKWLGGSSGSSSLYQVNVR
jgi:hypothetical protein